MPVSPTTIQLANQIGDVYWRLQNLYHCIDKKGNCVKFRMNDAQRAVFDDLWYRTIVPKSRQKGFTTFFSIVGLDTAMFRDDQKIGFLAHTAADAERIYIDKLLFPLDRMPPPILKANPTVRRQEAGGFVSFKNGSSVTVAQSFRSATLNYLHCSEMGKIAAAFPHRCREIISGTFPAVPRDGRIIVESTSEGASGSYYQLCMDAHARALAKTELSRLDFKIHFSGWTTDPDCVLPDDEATAVVITDIHEKYFRDLSSRIGETFTLNQKAWYVKMQETQKEFMFQEFPGDLVDSFKVVLDGAYYADQINQAREQGRIGEYPHVQGTKVHTATDIGVNDDTSIWFFQILPGEFRMLENYSASGVGLDHYMEYMKKLHDEKGYEYGEYWVGHDMAVREFTTGISRIETAYRKYGVHYSTAPNLSVVEGIDAVRRVFGHCTFDEAGCLDGINALSAYRREFDDKRGVYKNKPLHDWSEHASSAFRYFAVSKGILAEKHVKPEPPEQSLESLASIWNSVGV